MDSATLIQIASKKKHICVKCGQEIEGIICWRALKWSALRFFLLLLIWIPSLFLWQYQAGRLWAVAIGLIVLISFLVMLCSSHRETLRSWQKLSEQKETLEKDFERFIRQYQNKIQMNN